MKNIYLSSAFLLFMVSVQAQTITRSNLPDPGDAYEGITVLAESDETWNPGAAGDNQVWDFSRFTGDLTPFEYVPVNSSVYSSAQMKLSLGIMGEVYFAASESDYRMTGMASDFIEGIEFNVPYQNELVMFRFPMMYGSSFKDTARAEYTEFKEDVKHPDLPFPVSASVTTKRTTFSETTVDGRGILKLPGVEYQDVLRVRISSAIKDTAIARNLPIVGDYTLGTPLSSLEEYYFFSEDYKHQLAYFIRFSTDRGRPDREPLAYDYIFLYPSATPVVTSTLSAETEGNRVYPNPAQNLINFDLKDASSIELYDMKGQRVTQGQLSEGMRSLDISTVAPGVYTYRIATKSGEMITGKVTVR